MTVGRLKELLDKFDDEAEVMIRNSVNICGNISYLLQVEKSTYGSLGEDIDCVILNTYDSKRDNMEETEDGDIIDYIENTGEKSDK